MSCNLHQRLPPIALLLVIVSCWCVTTCCAQQQQLLKKPWWKRLLQRIIPIQKIQTSKWPQPKIIENFLTADESTILLERYRPLLRESLHKTADTNARRSIYRTSHTVRLPPLGDPLVFDIERRAAALLVPKTNHSRVEDFQLACYGPDELFGLHRDDDVAGAVNRSATVLIYLTTTERGGATLFTNLELEKEVDPQTKGPLRTEKGAVDLFRDYCKNPRRKHLVVDAVQGRGVVWKNWYAGGGDITGENTFAIASTHGACPVELGEKCVIQQWISRHKNNPLRDETVAAIFPAGADRSFGRDVSNCFSDVSAAQSTLHLCGEQVELVIDGPYPDIGAVRVLQSGLVTTLMSLKQQHPKPTDLTVSFWIRNALPGTTVLSLGDSFSIRLDERRVLHLGSGGATAEIALGPTSQGEWVWLSFAIQRGNVADVVVHSSSLYAQTASVPVLLNEESAVCDDSKPNTIALALLTPPTGKKNDESDTTFDTAFVKHEQGDEEQENIAFARGLGTEAQPPREHHAEVSFVIIHNAYLDHEERLALRIQTKRYNINL